MNKKYIILFLFSFSLLLLSSSLTMGAAEGTQEADPKLVGDTGLMDGPLVGVAISGRITHVKTAALDKCEFHPCRGVYVRGFCICRYRTREEQKNRNFCTELLGQHIVF